MNSKKQKPEIIKVQLAQFSTDGKKSVLIYNECRSIEHEQTLDKASALILEKQMGDEPKKFFWATVSKDKHLQIGEVAPWQTW